MANTPHIFNTKKSGEDYAQGKIFFNPPPGLVDTVNQRFPKIWALYQEMRSLDWNENEFNFQPCQADFKNAPADVSEMMLKTLLWQWEADSIASRAPTVIIAPFNPATEVWAAEQRITDNEQCLTEDHEVYEFTKGWISIKEVKEGDFTLNFNPKTHELRFGEVKKHIAKHYDGQLYHIHSRLFDQLVTEDHRMCRYIYNRATGGYSHNPCEARFLTINSTDDLVVSGMKQGMEMVADINDLSARDAMLIMLGARYYTSDTHGAIVALAKDKDELLNMAAIAHAAGYEFREFPEDLLLAVHPQDGEVFDLDGIHSLAFLDITNKSGSWCRQALEDIVLWNGATAVRTCNAHGRLINCYESAWDKIALLAHCCNKLAKRMDGKICVVNRSRYCTHNMRIDTQAYSGMVYCIRVDADAFLVRRNGIISISHNCHANTYSEIVRNGMENPRTVIEELLEEQEAFRRLNLVNEMLGEMEKYSRHVAYHGLDNVDKREAHRNLIKFYFAMLCLERIQFMASFAITFTIAKAGWFQEIGQAVKKIAQDEFEVHCEFRKEMIRELIADEEGQELMNELRPLFADIVNEVLASEIAWTKDFLFKGRNLTGTNADIVVAWVKFCAADVVRFAGLDIDISDWPKHNPMPHLDEWLNPNLLQAAPQEQTISAYKTNAVSDDVGADEQFDF